MKNIIVPGKKALSALLLLSASLVGSSLHARQGIRETDSIFSALYTQKKFNGNVLIAENGKPVYQKSFGYANFDTGEKLGNESVFELASCSKQFTAFAIALLQHQKKLRYTDDITRFLPALEAYKGITVLHLVHHTSGLADYMQLFDSLWDKTKIAGNPDVVSMFAQHKPPVSFAPGERFEYSNTGYALLASIIEKASGMSYAKYLEQHIFKPLGMKHSTVYNRRARPQKIDHYAFDFVYDDEKDRFVSIDSIPEAHMVYFLDGISGDGTVNTTTGDLLRWDQALYTEKLLPAGERAFVFTSGKTNDGKETGYAFGWLVESNKETGALAMHTGGWGGYVTYIERELDKHRTIIALQNVMNRQIPIRSIRLLLDGKPLPVAEKRTEISLDEKVLAQYTGAYEIVPEFVLEVTLKDGQLYAQATGQQAFPIYPQTELLFFLKVVDAQLEFVKDASGAVTKAILHQGGRDMDARKVR